MNIACLPKWLLLIGSMWLAQVVNAQDSLTISPIKEASDLYFETASEDRLTQLQQLAENPLEINHCTAAELTASGLLSEFQVFSLLDYRQRHGGVLSAGELSLVPGFDMVVTNRLAPFISFRPADNPSKTKASSGQLHLTAILPTKRDPKWTGSPAGTVWRGKFTPQPGVYAGFIAEKDPGEEWLSANGLPDLFTGFVQLSSRNQRFTVLAGDFQARYGQGLALWTGAVPISFSSVADIARKPTGFAPNYSRNENGYLRGGGLRFTRQKFRAEVYYSNRHRDATLQTDSAGNPVNFRSIYPSGLHRTTAELARNRTMHETVAGAYLHQSGRWYAVGLGGFRQQFSLPVDEQKATKAFSADNKQYSTLHTDYRIVAGHCQFWGELAYNPNGGLATVHFLQASLASQLNYLLYYRYFSPDYFSFFAEGKNSLSADNMQTGVYHGVEWVLPRLAGISVLSDVFNGKTSETSRQPASFSSDYFVDAQSRFSGPVSFRVRYRYQLRPVSEADTLQGLLENKQSIRIETSYKPTEVWWIRPRIDYRVAQLSGRSSTGWMLAIETGLKAPNYRRGITLQWARYLTDDFNSAIYMWQTDVQYEVNFPPSYGDGYQLAVSAFFKIKPHWRFAFSYANEWKKADRTALQHYTPGVEKIKGQLVWSW